jgi:hypothetical protein
MRGARYVRLIPWTLQSGSEQLLYLLCLTEAWVFAWIQNFLELVWKLGGGQGEGKAEARLGLLTRRRGDQLEPSRGGGNMIKDCEKPIQDVMQQGQQPIE